MPGPIFTERRRIELSDENPVVWEIQLPPKSFLLDARFVIVEPTVEQSFVMLIINGSIVSFIRIAQVTEESWAHQIPFGSHAYYYESEPTGYPIAILSGNSVTGMVIPLTPPFTVDVLLTFRAEDDTL